MLESVVIPSTRMAVARGLYSVWLVVWTHFGSVACIRMTSCQNCSSINASQTLRVLAISNPPYTLSQVESIGIDTIIIHTIARKLNMTIRFSRVSVFNDESIANITYVST